MGPFLLEKENREKRGSNKYVHSMQSTGLIIHIINVGSVDSCYDMYIYVMATKRKQSQKMYITANTYKFVFLNS